MREISSAVAKGLITKSSAPPSSPASRSSTAERAVITITGSSEPSRRQRDSSSKPLPSGNVRSSSTQSNTLPSSVRGASAARRRHSLLRPSTFSAACKARPRSRSSSISRICTRRLCMGRPLALPRLSRPQFRRTNRTIEGDKP